MKVQKSDSNFFQFIKTNRIAALIFGAAILFFYSCENNLEKIKAFSSPEDLPLLEAVNFETVFTDSGKVRFFMKTPKLLRFENNGEEYLEFPQGIEIIKYDADKNIVSSITSDYAKQFVEEQRWEAKNNVVATNLQGDTLKTEHLTWMEKEETISTEEFVEIIRADAIYTGVGLTSDQELVNWRIKKLKGIVYITVDNTKSNESGGGEEALPEDLKRGSIDKPLQIGN